MKFINYLIIILSFFINIFSQSVDAPVSDDEIYQYLSNLRNRGEIQFFDDIRPVSRIEIANKLIELGKKTNSLSNIEKDQLEFFKKEYVFEIKFLLKDSVKVSEFFTKSNQTSFSVYKYYDPQFTLVIDPIVGIGYDFSEKLYRQFIGVDFRGRISDFLGYYFNFRDNTERGDNLDKDKKFTKQTGVIISRSFPNSFEYSETRGGVDFSWAWGRVVFAKDFLNIGSSYQSSVILSSKAPSYPFIRLSIYPVDWFRYNFIHAWLNSDQVDSSSVRSTGINFEPRSLSYSKRSKYYVEHSLSIKPVDGLWLTFGESVIYGDEIDYGYFLPIFYRLYDHYNSKGGADSGDNAQIFLNFSYAWSKLNTALYATLYIDELSPSAIFSDKNNPQTLAFQIGSVIQNPVWSDNYFTLEYTRVDPYAYKNADSLQQYTNLSYQLGHWIGSNSDQFYFGNKQYLLRELYLSVYYQYIRSGSKENRQLQSDFTTHQFLYGMRSHYSEIGGQIVYNPIHNLFLELNFQYINKSTGRFTTEYDKQTGFNFGTMLRYGFQ